MRRPDLRDANAGRLGRNVKLLVVVAANLLLLAGGATCGRTQATTSSRTGNSPSIQPSPSTTACVPDEVKSPLPVAASAPMATARGACSKEALDSLFDACFQRGGDCKKWQAVNRSCARCAFTPEGAPQQGPFITRKNAAPKANQRGCLDSLAPSCGGAFEALDTCTHAACGDDKPGCKSATPSQRAACRQTSMQTSCANLTQLFVEKCGPGGLVDKRVCFPPPSDEAAMREYITGLARQACGSSGKARDQEQ